MQGVVTPCSNLFMAIRILCWNVNGIRSIWKKGFREWVQKESPDILCLQETKAQEEQLDDEIKRIDHYNGYFFSAERKGYSGLATYSKIVPLNVKKGIGNPYFDIEGRVLQTDYEEFSLFNVYFPNAGSGDERLRYKMDFYDTFFFYLERFRKKQNKIIVCGDFNTAHKEIDLAKPQQWGRFSGFLPIEREWLDQIINLGYIDVFREFNKEPGWYTYWDPKIMAREKNLGWRIDYFFVSKEASSMVTSARIHKDVTGSDHCPVELEIKI
jgi:exodeoxyribonuclease-3